MLQQLLPHEKDLGGGFKVRRLLPAAQRQSVGPFVFFDHFGPVTEQPQNQHDVRPHPHIGLATVTYLFSGAIMHRDSLGYAQKIEPGAINWMTAGRGIVHSERKPAELADASYINHGIQLWAALPLAFEEAEPAFAHTPAHAIPQVRVGDALVRVLIGEAFGAQSPVVTYAPTLYLDISLPAKCELTLPPLAAELALYLVDAAVQVDDQPMAAQSLVLLTPGQPTRISAAGPVRLMAIGGAPLDGRRYIWWNFVSSRKERIAQAAKDWEAGDFAGVAGDSEFIPLPATRFTVP